MLYNFFLIISVQNLISLTFISGKIIFTTLRFVGGSYESPVERLRFYVHFAVANTTLLYKSNESLLLKVLNIKSKLTITNFGVPHV